jgi:DNA (cytosine-5)-methyltransferase 1
VQDAAQGHLLPTWPAEISSTLDTTFGTKMGLENQHVNAGCPMFVPAQPIALAENTIGRQPENGGNGDGFTDGGPMYTLNATGVHGVAQAMAYNIAPGKGALKDDIHVTDAYATKTLDASGSNPAMHQGGAAILQSMAVRRLTPTECERLQGFPDNYTDIQSKGKPTPDGPRYKALGNSMAVPVMAWIGQRIEQTEVICQHKK